MKVQRFATFPLIRTYLLQYKEELREFDVGLQTLCGGNHQTLLEHPVLYWYIGGGGCKRKKQSGSISMSLNV